MLTFGIEEEYFITDLHSRQMVGEPSAAVLAACREAIGAGFSFEMFQGQIEAASPVFTSSAEAADYFSTVRGNLAQSLLSSAWVWCAPAATRWPIGVGNGRPIRRISGNCSTIFNT